MTRTSYKFLGNPFEKMEESVYEMVDALFKAGITTDSNFQNLLDRIQGAKSLDKYALGHEAKCVRTC